MAAQPDQPVSVDNLGAALGKAVGEVVLFTGSGSPATAYVDEPLSAFSGFRIVTGTMYGPDAPVTVPATAGSVSSPSSSIRSVTVSQYANGTGVSVSCSSNASPQVYRIVGIRAGGGQLVADLLAALGGGAR